MEAIGSHRRARVFYGRRGFARRDQYGQRGRRQQRGSADPCGSGGGVASAVRQRAASPKWKAQRPPIEVALNEAEADAASSSDHDKL